MIQDRSTYIREDLEHLNDCETYLKLDGDPTKSITLEINSMLNSYLKKDSLVEKWLRPVP